MDVLCRVILDIFRAAREAPLEEFQEVALSTMRLRLSFHSAMWGVGEVTADGVVTHSVRVHSESLETSHGRSPFRFRDAAIEAALAAPGCAKIACVQQLYRDAPDTIDFSRGDDHANALIVADVTRSDGFVHAQWVSLHRPDDQDHFGSPDQRALEVLMPHLVEALSINRLLDHKQERTRNAGSGLGVAQAVVHMDGTLGHAEKQFAEFLREAWPEWQSGQIPEELMAGLVPGKEAIFERRNVAVSASPRGKMLLLEIRRISPLNKLTPRELAVARLFGQGKSHKDIALLLEISPFTVRNFLHRVYTKLDINDKAELASLLVYSALPSGA